MKKIAGLLIITSVLLFNNSVKSLEINSKYAVLYDLTNNEIIYEKNKDDKTSIASLTKIMTSIIAIENIEDLNVKVTIPYGATAGLVELNAAVVGFIEGQSVTYNDLLYGALLPSGADATQSLALLISGSKEKFIELMNKKAKELGMENTRFNEVSGFDVENQYSTANDLLILLKYALKNSKFKKIYETKFYTTSDNRFHIESTIVKPSERFNINISNIKGSKTGFTNAAGYCLASEFIINDTTFLSVTINADPNGNPNHIIDANKIYKYITETYSLRPIMTTNMLALTLKPKYAKEQELEFYTNKNISKFIKNDEQIELKYIYNGQEDLFGNEKKGTHLGSIDVTYKNEVIDTIDVILNTNLTFDYFKYLKQYIYLLPIIVLLITAAITILKIMKNKKHLKLS